MARGVHYEHVDNFSEGELQPGSAGHVSKHASHIIKGTSNLDLASPKFLVIGSLVYLADDYRSCRVALLRVMGVVTLVHPPMVHHR